MPKPAQNRAFDGEIPIDRLKIRPKTAKDGKEFSPDFSEKFINLA